MADGFRGQNTHWYRAGTEHGGRGYTADPRYASPEEVERVGLHECQTRGCEERHAGNGDDYRRYLIVTGMAGEAEG